jgi:hypothetical protein
MASTFHITHRRMAKSPSGTHVHVGWVKLRGGTVLTRDEVFSWMRGGNIFKTYAPNGLEAKVLRVKCSRCSCDYLRSERDSTTTDNLDELPLF